MVKVLIIQPRPAARLESPKNLDLALRLLESCRGQGADLICLPEYFPFSGEAELARAARQLQAYIVAGLVTEDRGVRYNTATLFDREGRLVGRQRKVNLGALEVRGFGVSPGERWQALDTDFGRLGLAVCIDFWGQPDAARHFSAQDADLIVNPSIFPILRGHWKTGALVRSFDHYLPVVGGEHRGFFSGNCRTAILYAGRRLFRSPAAGPAGGEGTGPPHPRLGRPGSLDRPGSRR